MFLQIANSLRSILLFCLGTGKLFRLRS